MAFILIVVCYCSLPKLKITLALYLLRTFAQQNTLCAQNKLCAWAADNFPPLDMAFLPTVL